MSGANLDGYSYGREGIHKVELTKKVDKLEQRVVDLERLVNTLLYDREKNKQCFHGVELPIGGEV